MTTSVIQQKGLPKDYFASRKGHSFLSQKWGETPSHPTTLLGFIYDLASLRETNYVLHFARFAVDQGLGSQEILNMRVFDPKKLKRPQINAKSGGNTKPPSQDLFDGICGLGNHPLGIKRTSLRIPSDGVSASFPHALRTSKICANCPVWGSSPFRRVSESGTLFGWCLKETKRKPPTWKKTL